MQNEKMGKKYILKRCIEMTRLEDRLHICHWVFIILDKHGAKRKECAETYGSSEV